jgi:hypothetical protein
MGVPQPLHRRDAYGLALFIYSTKTGKKHYNNLTNLATRAAHRPSLPPPTASTSPLAATGQSRRAKPGRCRLRRKFRFRSVRASCRATVAVLRWAGGGSGEDGGPRVRRGLLEAACRRWRFMWLASRARSSGLDLGLHGPVPGMASAQKPATPWLFRGGAGQIWFHARG